MKKIQGVIVMMMVLGLFSNVFGEESRAKKVYVEVGLSGAYENFNTNLNFDGTSGLNARLGFYFTQKFACELEYNNLPGFKNTSNINGVQDTSEIDIVTYNFNVKYDAYSSKRIAVYVTCGIGNMEVEANMAENLDPHWTEDIEGSHSSMCFKAGFGMDYFFTDSIGLKMEMCNVFGTGDIDIIKYNNWVLGLACYF